MDYIKGCDISHFNHPFPWGSLSKDIKFVFCKASEGAVYKDPYFNEYWQHLKATDLKRGAYHFFKPNVSAEEQVDNFLSLGMDFSKPCVLPPVLDIEQQADNGLNGYMRKHPSQIIDMISEWFELVKERTGRDGILYSNKSFFPEYLANHSWPNNGLWIAAYQKPLPGLPIGYKDWQFWQFSQYGNLNGVGGNTNKDGSLDLNYFNGTMEQLNKLCNIHN